VNESPLAQALERVGDRWTLLVVDALLGGPRRFNELLEDVGGIAPNTLTQRLRHLEREALLRLRAFVEGKATLVQRGGKPTIDYPAVQNRLRITPEQEAALSATGRELQAQGVAVTARALAQAAGVGLNLAQQFLRQHRAQFPAGPTSTASRHQDRLAHVAAIYAEHLAQGKPITSSKTLARAAHVRIETALEFLRAERSKSA